MTDRSAVRVNRRAPYYVQVESDTVRDTRLSYRALGVLTYCLDQADSWCVRSEQLARGEGREGRDAVRKALHELAANGYYRLERRRFFDGKTAMGAAISVYSNEQWASDYVAFGGKLDIPVVEQEDGSFRVRYPDDTFGPDGFEAGDDSVAPDGETDGVPDEPATQPQRQKKKRPTPPAATRSAAKKARQGAPATKAEPEVKQQQAVKEKKAEPEGEQKESKEKSPAQEVATWYYGFATERLGPYAGKRKSGWFFGLVKLSQQALDADYTQKQVAKALQRTGVHFPTAYQFQRALSDERNNKPVPGMHGGRPAPYSDAETWGTDGTGGPPTDSAMEASPDDDVTFGIVAA
ncbi:hypothetical protein [Streptomyces sp. NPDC020965]|uniref:hypothetical protein n=1 Tax=Streptomyces sp. NPDC020965 TaxID=3365105 RepID=UPI0037B782C4